MVLFSMAHGRAGRCGHWRIGKWTSTRSNVRLFIARKDVVIDIGRKLALNRGGRLGVRGARDILARLAEDAGIEAEDFTSHVLRHTFGTTLVRGGHALVLVAELMGHRRLETTRGYALPSATDRERAINSLPTDR